VEMISMVIARASSEPASYGASRRCSTATRSGSCAPGGGRRRPYIPCFLGMPKPMR